MKNKQITMLARQLLSSRLLALIFCSGWRGRITHNKVQATQRLHAFACVYPSDNTEYKLNFSLQYFMMWMGEVGGKRGRSSKITDKAEIFIMFVNQIDCESNTKFQAQQCVGVERN